MATTDTISLLSLIELAPYIKGDMILPGAKEYKSIEHMQLQEFVDKLEQYPIAKNIFNELESSTDFFKICTDFAVWFKKSEHTDLFYAAKCGYMFNGVPPKLVYMLQLALKDYNAPNLAIKYLNKNTLTHCFQKGAFGDKISLYTIIANMIGKSYVLFDENNFKNPCGDFTEVYIPTEDMVALLPTTVAKSFDTDFIKTIRLTDIGLCGEEGVEIAKLAGFKYNPNSFFDLRYRDYIAS